MPGVTDTTAEVLFPDTVAVIVAVPKEMPVTIPSEFTSAIFGFDDFHTILPCRNVEASSGLETFTQTFSVRVLIEMPPTV